ncbi:type II toxin-antitoxin system VapC family toxin [Maricaulis sp.]|uniref:type II toxin-antitoxin system VapC family toxin n=1 Tax=Maricaulis sp. TaxID=1486257 RepID=UPI003A901409
MKTVVLDASVAVKWFVDDHLTEQALRAAEIHTFRAPWLVLTETANGLWKYARRGDLDPADMEAALRHVEANVACVPDPNLMRLAARLACQLDHPVYDCCYLAMASMVRLPLLTADKRLSALARDLSLDVVDLASIPLEG